MPPAPQPFSFAGALQLSADPTLPQDPVPFNFSGQFTALASGTLSVTGTGTLVVPFGTIATPGAKGLLIRYDGNQQGAAAVLVTINSGTQPIEITPGGFLVYFNPTPSAGVTSCSIAYTAACQLRVWVLG